MIGGPFLEISLCVWPNTRQTKPAKTSFRPNNEHQPNDIVHSDSSVSTVSSVPSTSNRVYTKVKKRQKSQQDPPFYQKRRNTNEHLGESTNISTKVTGNANTPIHSDDSTNSTNTSFFISSSKRYNQSQITSPKYTKTRPTLKLFGGSQSIQPYPDSGRNRCAHVGPWLLP